MSHSRNAQQRQSTRERWFAIAPGILRDPQPTANELPKSLPERITKGPHQDSPSLGPEEKQFPYSGSAQDGSTDPDIAARYIQVGQGPSWATASFIMSNS